MSKLSRRKLLTAGLATAGVSGLGVAARLANRYGLIPPDHGGLYGPGQTLTYASQRLLTRNALAREFSPKDISTPCVNGTPPKSEDFQRLRAGGFAEWQIQLDGMVSRPRSYLLSEIKKFPARSQITQPGVRRGLVVHRRMDRVAAGAPPGGGRDSPAGQVCRVLLDGSKRSKHVGKH